MGETQTLLRVEELSKRFFAIQALDRVSMELKQGTITALIGENGAGKSTLVKILAGYYRPDSGRIILDGEPVSFSSVTQAQERGISVIHQIPSYAPDLSVVDNIFLGRELKRAGRGSLIPRLDRASEVRELLPLLAQYGATFRPEERMRYLKAYQQRLVGILKALVFSARILIMDEPTAALPLEERELLLQSIRRLREEGYSILYVSHHMDEIESVADEVVALRNGVQTGYSASVPTQQRMIEMMTGDRLQDISELYDRQIPSAPHPKTVRPGGWSFHLTPPDSPESGTLVRTSVTLKVKPGELTVLTGIVGSGAKDIAEALYGYRPGWRVVLMRPDGSSTVVTDPQKAVSLGIGYLSDDRISEAMIKDFSIRENMTISMLKKIATRFGQIAAGEERKAAEELGRQLSIKMSGIDQKITDLSGGNQQKVMLARWIFAEVQLLILNEPTQGIDVMAKRDVIRLLREMTGSGGICILATNDPQEFLHIADRVIVMRKGSVVGDYYSGEISSRAVFEAMLASSPVRESEEEHSGRESE